MGRATHTGNARYSPEVRPTVCTVSNIGPLPRTLGISGSHFMLRRLEDRIRELCAKTITARGSEELEPVLCKLKIALNEHTDRIRRAAIAKLVVGGNGSPPERRST